MAVNILSTKVPEIMSTMWYCYRYMLVNVGMFTTVFTPDVNKYFQKCSRVVTNKVKSLCPTL